MALIRCSILAVVAVSALTAGCASPGDHLADGHPSRSARRSARQLARANAESLPTDMGAPLADLPSSPQAAGLSIDVPIASIAAEPDGRAVLEKDMPGLLERPEFPPFKSMSLKALAGVAHGRNSTAKLNEVEADLMKAGHGAQPLRPDR